MKLDDVGILIVRLVGEYFNEDDLQITDISSSHYQLAFLVETPDQRLVLRFANNFHVLERNAKALMLLSGRGIAPELLFVDQHSVVEKLFFSFEEAPPGTHFPYAEREKKQKIIPIIAKHYTKLMAVKFTDEQIKIEKENYSHRMLNNYFKTGIDRFSALVKDESLKSYMQDNMQEPSRIGLVHGKFTLENIYFHEGHICFSNFTRSYLAEPELDWGCFCSTGEMTEKVLANVSKQLDLDQRKVYYYAMLFCMEKCSLTRKKSKRNWFHKAFYLFKNKFEALNP